MEVVNTSDGDDHQLQDNGSCQLLMTEIHDDHSSDSELFRRLMRINEVRKNSRSTSDHSNVERQNGLDYHAIALKNEETNMDQQSMMVDH